MPSLPKLLILALLQTSFAQAQEAGLKDCLAQAGEVAPNAESLALAVSGALTKDTFLHRAYLSPMEYRMHDPRKLAEMLVARLHEECDGPRTLADSEAVDSEVVMMVPSKNLDAIAKFGFQNQHTTQTTGGANAAAVRFETEQNMVFMQMPYGAKTRDILPKYAAFDLKSSKYGSYRLPKGYGDIALIFKPATKKRTTFTFLDSLSQSAFFEGPNIYFPPRTTKFRGPTNNDPAQNPHAATCMGYCEAQVWGPLDLSDVEYLMVQAGTQVPESAKRTGLPIYEAELASDFQDAHKDQSANYKKGKLLFPARRPAPTPALYGKADLAKEIKSAPDGPVRKILENRQLGLQTENDLIEHYNAAKSAPEADPGSFGPMTKQARIFSELGTRPLSAGIEKVLIAEAKSSDPAIRKAALLGLSDLPIDRFRPYLLTALKDGDKAVRLLAIAIALDSNDPEVKKALEEMAKVFSSTPFPPPEAWAYKLWKRKKYCEKE